MSSTGTAPPVRAPSIPLLRLVFGVVGVAAFVLGFIGLEEFLTAAGPPPRMIDILYYDLQLFVLESGPLQAAGAQTYPVPLEIARFAAPAATVLAVVEAGRAIVAFQLRRVRIRRTSGHAVVCGGGPMALALVTRLERDREPVIWVYPQPVTARRRRTFLVAGDPADPETLRDAGVGRARVVYACTEDSAVNASIAQAAGHLARRRRHPLAVYAMVHDAYLCLALQARRLGQRLPTGLHVDFFNADDLAARTLFVRDPLRPHGDHSPLLVIAGTSALGRAVIVAAARQWRLANAPAKLALHVVGHDARESVDELLHRYPFISDVCLIETHHRDLIDLLTAGEFNRQPERVYLCHDDEALALKTALTAQVLWRGGPQSVLVRLNRLAGYTQAFQGTNGDALLDEASGKVRLYRVFEAAADPHLIADDLVARLAKVIHDHYVAKRRARHDATGPSDVLVPWEELPAHLRTANREQARAIGTTLRAVGCILTPRVPGNENALLTDEEIDVLARREHARWVLERRAAGWRPGPPEEARRRHPDLRDWDDLSDDARQKSQDAVRELPTILAEAGFQIVRVPE